MSLARNSFSALQVQFVEFSKQLVQDSQLLSALQRKEFHSANGYLEALQPQLGAATAVSLYDSKCQSLASSLRALSLSSSCPWHGQGMDL